MAGAASRKALFKVDEIVNDSQSNQTFFMPSKRMTLGGHIINIMRLQQVYYALKIKKMRRSKRRKIFDENQNDG